VKASNVRVFEQSEDVWSRTVTVNGYRADEVRSVLQKSIRRGLVEEAVLAAYELYSTGPEAEEMLWRRLEIITTEDVGTGLPNGPALIEALNRQRQRAVTDDRWMFSVHAVRLLATASKDRTTMELATWAKTVVGNGERQLTVEDYHVDFHTRRGRAMSRGREHWWQEGARLDNEVEGLTSIWGDYLRAHRDAGGSAAGQSTAEQETDVDAILESMGKGALCTAKKCSTPGGARRP
jgi:replication-associated recombination protein RarA